MTHEWLRIIGHVDAHPESDAARLVKAAIRQVHDAGPRVTWDDVLLTVTTSRETPTQLCDAYLLHYWALGGRRVAA